DLDYLGAADNAKIIYLIARRSILAGKGNSFFPLYDLTGDQNAEARRRLEREVIWGTLMPWENHRAVRRLNLLSFNYVSRQIDVLQAILKGQFRPMGDWNLDANSFLGFANVTLNQRRRNPQAVEDDQSIRTTIPELSWVEPVGTASVRQMAEFEAQRR